MLADDQEPTTPWFAMEWQQLKSMDRLDQSFTRRCALRFYRLFMVLGLTEGPATGCADQTIDLLFHPIEPAYRV